MAELLIEIFSEEIPARMQRDALEHLLERLSTFFADAGLFYGAKTGYVTPRRLVVMFDDLPMKSLPKQEERKGPGVAAPKPAIDGFLRATGLSLEALEIRDLKGVPTYFAVTTQKGRDAAEIVSMGLETVIREFSWPKSMRWGSGTLRWVRPLRNILAILKDGEKFEIVPLEIDGIQANNQSFGHRFMAPDSFEVHSIAAYQDALAKAFVVLDQEARKSSILGQIQNAAFALGLDLVENEKLLWENVGLVEYPVVHTGLIEPEFHDLPPELIQTSMAEHQKFLSLRDPKTGKIQGYVIVANLATQDDGATIRAGNAKVLRARLKDAQFFWESDLHTIKTQGFTPWLDKLDHVTFHNKLGSIGARITRLEKLARIIAQKIGANPETAAQAARLAKTDLASKMVYEFPELQGVMGDYYARAAGFSDDIADCVRAHYAPLGPTDDVPTQPISICVALADKIDMLAGFWAIDEKPTGSKDPFALRRAALGIIRIILENKLEISLLELFGFANESCDASDLLRFVLDRFGVYLREQGLRHDILAALRGAEDQDDLGRLSTCAWAMNAFLETEAGKNLQIGMKRAFNILAAEEKKDGVFYELPPEKRFFRLASEENLFEALADKTPKIQEAIHQGNYDKAMSLLGDLRDKIDAFFDEATVNAPEQILRRNRLCLLNQIREISYFLGDIRKLEG